MSAPCRLPLIGRLALALMLLGSCGGEAHSDDAAFTSWYKRAEDSRLAVAGAGATRYSQAEGLATARSTCATLTAASKGDSAATSETGNRMENSLSGRYFIDAVLRWQCPRAKGVVDRLIKAGTVDIRAKCSEMPDEIDCAVAGPDPLK